MRTASPGTRISASRSIGKLDPKTGKVTEYPVPELEEGLADRDCSSLRSDKDGNMWARHDVPGRDRQVRHQDREVQIWNLPPEMNRRQDPGQHGEPDDHRTSTARSGRRTTASPACTALDLKTGRWETLEPFKAVARSGHNIYDVIADSQNNAYFTDIGHEHIGRIDAKTGKVTLYQTPTKARGPRRGMMDAQDRLWFARISRQQDRHVRHQDREIPGMAMPTPWTQPYDVALDKNGEAWTGSMLNDRIVRLDPKTGTVRRISAAADRPISGACSSTTRRRR